MNDRAALMYMGFLVSEILSEISDAFECPQWIFNASERREYLRRCRHAAHFRHVDCPQISVGRYLFGKPVDRERHRPVTLFHY
jgi:hypothetical protein